MVSWLLARPPGFRVKSSDMSHGTNEMTIDRARLAQTIEELGRIGETPRGGLTRLALSDDDRRGRDWMVARMGEAGLRVSVDQMGNIFGERAGTEPLPP